MRISRICLFVLVLVTVSCVQQAEPVCCVAVSDGDTFRVESGEEVRLIGIDAPELDEPGGEIARDYLCRLILDKEVVIVSGSEERDEYGRLLGVVYVDGICVNEEMIKNGYAEVRYLSPDDPLLDQYIQLEITAESRKAGLWGGRIFQPRSDLNWEEDISVIDWKDADNYYGQYVIVEGTIVDTYNSGQACFLNFHTEWEKYFTAVIFACDFASFPANPEVYYLGNKVQIIGIIKEYKGSPEIIVKTPGQIRIMAKASSESELCFPYYRSRMHNLCHHSRQACSFPNTKQSLYYILNQYRSQLIDLHLV